MQRVEVLELSLYVSLTLVEIGTVGSPTVLKLTTMWDMDVDGSIGNGSTVGNSICLRHKP